MYKRQAWSFSIWQVECALGIVKRGACFAGGWIGEGATTVNLVAESAGVIDPRSS